jgi:tousled-like kinase
VEGFLPRCFEFERLRLADSFSPVKYEHLKQLIKSIQPLSIMLPTAANNTSNSKSIIPVSIDDSVLNTLPISRYKKLEAIMQGHSGDYTQANNIMTTAATSTVETRIGFNKVNENGAIGFSHFSSPHNTNSVDSTTAIKIIYDSPLKSNPGNNYVQTTIKQTISPSQNSRGEPNKENQSPAAAKTTSATKANKPPNHINNTSNNTTSAKRALMQDQNHSINNNQPTPPKKAKGAETPSPSDIPPQSLLQHTIHSPARIQLQPYTAESNANNADFIMQNSEMSLDSHAQKQQAATKGIYSYFSSSRPVNRPPVPLTTNENSDEEVVEVDSITNSNNSRPKVDKKQSTDKKKPATTTNNTSKPNNINNINNIGNNNNSNEVSKREAELKAREAELEAREKDFEQKQRLSLNTSCRIEELQQQLQQQQLHSDQLSVHTRQLMADLIRDNARKQRRENETKLLTESQAIGRLVTQREGHLMHEVWEDGEQFREIRLKIAQLNEEKEKIETERKRLNKRKTAVNKTSNTKSNTSPDKTNGDNNNNSGNNTTGNGSAEFEFKKPAAIALPSAHELFEMDEVYKLRLNNIKRDLQELKEREQLLENAKKSLIRFQKLLSDENNSRWNNFQLLNDRYILIHLLGKGGFSEVYKAFDLQEFRYVAVKLHQLNPHWSDERKMNYTRHATREYNIHKNLVHSRVVQLFDVFAIDCNAFATVLDFCDGGDLDLYLKQKQSLNEREARCIIMQVLSGLQYLAQQKQKIIHYDLKPGNILFHQGEAKITDFGLSKIIENNSNSSAEIELTSQGAGTYWYLPPETFSQNAMISNRVDIWSCGVILYQMLIGKKPFGQGMSPESLLQQSTMSRASGAVVDFPAKPQLSDVTKDFIRKCLAYKPVDRPDIMTIFDEPFFKANMKS